MLPAMSNTTPRRLISIANETSSEPVLETTRTSHGDHTFFTKPALPITLPIDVPTLSAKKVHGKSPQRR